MKFFKKKDILIILAILSILGIAYAITTLLSSEKGTFAVIMNYNEIVETVDLSQNQIIDINGVVIEIKDGEIFFTHSDCPDKVCINTGKLSISGQSAACLPNGIVVTIHSDQPKLDAIS